MRSLRYLLIPVIAAIVCGAIPGPADAQVLPGLVPASASPRPTLFETAPVIVDGSTVVRIAAPASPAQGAMPIEMRSFLIAGAISQLLSTDLDSDKTTYDPASFKVATQKEGSEAVLVATDARHRTPYPILTVTTDDARRANLTVADLAQLWQASLQSALVAALARRQPESIHRNTEFILRASIVLAVLSLIGILLFRFLSNRAAATIAAWVLLLLWVAAITYALLQFPQTVGYGQGIVRLAWRVAFVWIAAFIADRLVAIAIRQAVHWWAMIGPPGVQARSLLRVPTMSKALIGFSTFIIIIIAVLVTLSELQVPIASVVTIGGIAAVAIGFAAQSLVRDCLGGLLVLFEDQYVEGDYIMIGDYNGIVEHLTLRVVQIRDSRGNLVTIPHSSAALVVNSSRTWSRVDYRVSVEAGSDPHKALDVLRDTLEGLRSDARWHDAIVEPVEWIGIEDMSRNGVVLRAVIRTKPLRQFEVRREINLRVYEALAKAGVALGNNPSAPFVTAPQASPDPS